MNGQLNVKGNHTNGKKNGHWEWFLEGGEKDMQGDFVDDVQQGDWIYWYKNGNKQYWGAYEDGRCMAHGNINIGEEKNGSRATMQKD
ncbi:MAG: hypothetical protein R2809_02650 [Flavobacteriales bacterium]